MQRLKRLSIIEQTAVSLRANLHAGRWNGTLPGVVQLAQQLDVATNTMRAALRLLEAEGLVTLRGNGRSRTVNIIKIDVPQRSLRVAVLLHWRLVDDDAGFQPLLLQLLHDIEAAGHICVFARKSQAELGHNLKRIAQHVRITPADAWVIIGGSLELLQWFSTQTLPAIAFGGRRIGLPLASVGVDRQSAYVAATRHLISLGHRRIVFLCSKEWRHPIPGVLMQAFTEELAAHGITATNYHVPDWEESPEGLYAILTELFRITPPTAIIVMFTNWVVTVLSFLAKQKLQVPTHVSVISDNFDVSLAWHRPPLAHFHVNEDLSLRRIVRWIEAVAKGRADRKCISYPAKFVLGSTIGPPPTSGS